MQLRMTRDARLDQQSALVGIDTGSQPVQGYLDDVCAELRNVRVFCRERMPIHDAVKALVGVLQSHPVVQGPDQVTQVEPARGAHAAENAIFHNQ